MTRQYLPTLLRKFLLFIPLLCLLALGQATSQAATATDVSGPIFQNTTWSKAGSPYIVTGSVLVMSGAMLTIEPGVEVRFDAEKALSIQEGTLIAQGTAAEPIKFTANTALPQKGFWGYIQFEADTVDAVLDVNGDYESGSILQHVVVEYSGYTPQFSQESGSIRIKDAAPLIDQSIVRDSGSDGVNVSLGAVTISNSEFRDNDGAGIYINNTQVGGHCPPLPVSITDNVGAGNSGEGSYGSALYAHAAGKTVSNNLVENNSGTGINVTSCNYDEPLADRIAVDNNVVRFNRDEPYQRHAVTADWSVVSNNQVYGNQTPGVWIRDGVVTRNIIADNEGVGLELYSGFVTGSGVQATYNQIANNRSDWRTAGILIDRYSFQGGTFAMSHNSIVFNRAEDGQGAAAYFQKCGYDHGIGPLCNFSYNTVVGQSAPGSATGGIFYHEDNISSEYDGLVMNHNNLHSNQGYEFYHDVPQAGGAQDARFNWWGTADTNRINNEIHDFIDDSSLAIIDYSDFLDAPNTEAPPAPPTGLAVALVGETFDLTWDANPEADIAGYKVFYDVDSGYPWEGTGANQGDAGIDVGNNTSFNLSGLPANRTLYFTVLAYDDTGEESWYAREVVKRLPAPIFLTAQAGSVNVSLAWNATNDASVTHYRVSRAISGTTSFQALAPQHADTAYFDEDTSLIAGADYCYQVEAMNGENDLIITSDQACVTFGKLSLYVPDTVGASGGSVIVPINIRNADGLRIGASDIWLEFDPNVVEFTAVERTPLTIDYAWAHAAESVDGDTSRVRISYIHNVPNQDPPELYGNGSLFWIKFGVTGNDGATSPLDMVEFVQGVGGSAIQNENLTDLALEVVDGLFTFKAAGAAAFILGDVDGDGVVRALDAALALRLAAGSRTPTPAELQAGDVNGNGVIQAADASMVLYFAGNGVWPPLPPASRTAAARHAQTTTLILDNVVGKPGSTVQTTLRGTGLSAVAGGDFVIVYDTKLVVGISQVAKAGLAAAFDALEFQDDGTGRVFISMADDVEINGDGLLLTLDVQLANAAKVGDSASLLLAEAQLNDLNGRDFVTGFPDNTLMRTSGLVELSPVQISPTYLTFTATKDEGNPAAQTLTVDLGGTSESWTASSDQAWLSASPPSGNGDGSVDVSVDVANLHAGTHSGQIIISVGGKSINVSINVTVEDPAATLSVTPDSFSFSATAGGSNPNTQSLTVDPGHAGTNWNVSVDHLWLNISPASGTGPGSANVSVDINGLSAGSYSGQIQVAANGETANRSVTLTIVEPGQKQKVFLPAVQK